jgi:hypothetical protein
MTSPNALKHGRNVIVEGCTLSENFDPVLWLDSP